MEKDKMPNLFHPTIKGSRLEQYTVPEDNDIFNFILGTMDSFLDKSFFIHSISPEEVAKYDLSDKESILMFREDVCDYYRTPKIAGYNFNENVPEELRCLRTYGIALCDPTQRIIGQFDIFDDFMVYGNDFGTIDGQRDNIKFARTSFYTTIGFETIAKQMINRVNKYYISVSYDQRTSKTLDIGAYYLNPIKKDEMIEFMTKPEKGARVRQNGKY